MKNSLSLIFISSLVFLFACSSTKTDTSVSITPASSGVVKNSIIPFTLYLTDKIEARSEVERKTNANVYIVHTGHFLGPKLSKKENMAILDSFEGKGINAINLTMEDFIIAEAQGISLGKYPYRFLNSSVVDLNEDSIVSGINITPYIIHQGVAIIGLSDKKLDKSLNAEKYLVSDYVLAILRARKAALKESMANPDPEFPLKNYILVHTMNEKEIREVLERLPPNFINSLAD